MLLLLLNKYTPRCLQHLFIVVANIIIFIIIIIIIIISV